MSETEPEPASRSIDAAARGWSRGPSSFEAASSVGKLVSVIRAAREAGLGLDVQLEVERQHRPVLLRRVRAPRRGDPLEQLVRHDEADGQREALVLRRAGALLGDGSGPVSETTSAYTEPPVTWPDSTVTSADFSLPRRSAKWPSGVRADGSAGTVLAGRPAHNAPQ